MPFLIRADGLRFIGYSDETPGGYGEYIRLTEGLLLEVPNGLPVSTRLQKVGLTDTMSLSSSAAAQ